MSLRLRTADETPTLKEDDSDDSGVWVQALAKHCHPQFCVDALWFWLHDPECNPSYLAASGWFSESRMKASQTSQTTDGLISLLTGSPHAFARAGALTHQEGSRSAAFRMNRATFTHFFGVRSSDASSETHPEALGTSARFLPAARVDPDSEEDDARVSRRRSGSPIHGSGAPQAQGQVPRALRMARPALRG